MRLEPSGTNRLTALLGIDLPVIQAPMAGVQDAQLATAISDAGGLGSLPCVMLNADALERELHRLGAATGRPYNVNFFCHETPVVSNARAQDWIARLPTRALVERMRAAEARGRDDFTPLWCGQDPSGCAAIPAAEILQRLLGSL